MKTDKDLDIVIYNKESENGYLKITIDGAEQQRITIESDREIDNEEFEQTMTIIKSTKADRFAICTGKNPMAVKYAIELQNQGRVAISVPKDTQLNGLKEQVKVITAEEPMLQFAEVLKWVPVHHNEGPIEDEFKEEYNDQEQPVIYTDESTLY